jgi:BolA protein
MEKGRIEGKIEALLMATYAPIQLEIVNESDLHSGPKGRESHFKVLVVSDLFKDMKPIDRQKHIFQTLKDLMPRIHALSLRALTSDQIAKAQDFKTPNCITKK